MKAKLRSGGRIVLLGFMLALATSHPVSPAHSESPHFIYLPAIFSPARLLPNGDFEAGETAWILNPTGEQLIFSQDELPPSYVAHSGSHVAWLGNHLISDQAVNQSIRQQIEVPASNSMLYFWIVSDSAEYSATSQDYLRILIDGQLEQSWRLYTGLGTFTWRRQSVNLSGYAGKSVSLTVQVITNDVSPSEVYLDDFSFSP